MAKPQYTFPLAELDPSPLAIRRRELRDEIALRTGDALDLHAARRLDEARAVEQELKGLWQELNRLE